MKNHEENLVVHKTGRYVAELAIRGANGNIYSVYQKRFFGAEAGG